VTEKQSVSGDFSTSVIFIWAIKGSPKLDVTATSLMARARLKLQ
jgi:hypothetical protein